MSDIEKLPSSVEAKPGDVEAEVLPMSFSSEDEGLPPASLPSAEEERRIWRKIDRRIIPIATAMYLVSYLDRGNIGNAKLQGLLTQLDLDGERYNIALTMFYLFYLLFTIPSNLVLKKFRPSRWLPGLTLAWGIAAALTGIVKSFHQLIGVRICLGAAESGLSPGIYYWYVLDASISRPGILLVLPSTYRLSMWYPRHMLQWRFGLFFGGATFAGAFSGLLAYGISFMSGAGGLLGWSWIFIIEGLLTVVVALVAFAVFVDLPDTATFLTPDERAFVIRRLKDDNGSVGEEEGFRLRHLRDALFDWTTISGSVGNMAVVTPIYGTALFLPSIINGFGFNTAISQLLTVPAYIIATVTVLLCSKLSDHIKLRSPFVFAGLLLSFIGFAVNASDASIGVKYFGTYLIVIGCYLSAPIIIVWLGNNTVGHYKRGIGIGIQVLFGNIGGIVASNAYRVRDAPRYLPGHAAELALTGMGLVLVPFTAFAYWRANRQRDEKQRRGMDMQDLYTVEELKEMGERAPAFRYTL